MGFSEVPLNRAYVGPSCGNFFIESHREYLAGLGISGTLSFRSATVAASHFLGPLPSISIWRMSDGTLCGFPVSENICCGGPKPQKTSTGCASFGPCGFNPEGRRRSPAVLRACISQLTSTSPCHGPVKQYHFACACWLHRKRSQRRFRKARLA